ncbi:recombinase family protein [Mammaliicoccus sp. D-M17]|uniref:recombinase family protein n=1 Tax=Mammaliicoccus sp. D-M17 TaxID=2898677 RepID=UPI001EFBF62B|nr:recombinase family protein [Mammaliicoccus sp. D-M17]
MKTALYLRVSTTEQAKNNFSLRAQEDRLRSYASAKSLSDIRIYNDGGYSGSNMDRPALTKLLHDVQNNEVDTILIYKLDRLSRSQKDTLYLIEEKFLKNDVPLISLSESFDTSTPFGRAMVGMLSVFAQLERENIKERMIMGREQRLKKGLWHGAGGGSGRVAGYDYKDGKLDINEYEALFVRRMFQLYVEGKGYFNIYKKLSKEMPGIIKEPSNISKLLKNPVYIGMIDYNGETYKGIHEPIIDEHTFNTVQKLRRTRTVNRDMSITRYLLPKLLKCGYCGENMIGKTGSKKKDGTYYTYYCCYSKEIKRRKRVVDSKFNHECESVYHTAQLVEDKVINEVMNLDSTKIIRDYETKNDDHIIYEKQIKDIDTKIEKLMNLYIDSNIDKKTLDVKHKELEDEKHLVEKTMHDSKADVNREVVLKHLSNFKDIDWVDDREALKNSIHILIKDIRIYNDSMKVNFNI